MKKKKQRLESIERDRKEMYPQRIVPFSQNRAFSQNHAFSQNRCLIYVRFMSQLDEGGKMVSSYLMLNKTFRGIFWNGIYYGVSQYVRSVGSTDYDG